MNIRRFSYIITGSQANDIGGIFGKYCLLYQCKISLGSMFDQYECCVDLLDYGIKFKSFKDNFQVDFVRYIFLIHTTQQTG